MTTEDPQEYRGPDAVPAEVVRPASSLLGTSLDLDRVLPEFIQNAMGEIEADALVVLVENRDRSQALACRFETGLGTCAEAWKEIPNRLNRRVSEAKGRWLMTAIDESPLARQGLLPDVGLFRQALLTSLYTGTRSLGVFVALRRSGTEFSPKEIEHSTDLAHRLAVAIDHERVYEELAASERRYNLATKGALGGLWDWDVIQGKVQFSSRWCTLLGMNRGAFTGTADDWLSRVHPEDLEVVQGAIDAHLSGETEELVLEHRLLHENGGYRWMLARGFPVRDSTKKAIRIVGSHTDISAKKAAFRQLLHDAYHDSLTGLPNRSLFMDRLEENLMSRLANPKVIFSVMTVRINRFPNFFDTLGYSPTDQLLVRATARVRTALPEGTMMARLHGDGFALLLQEGEEVAAELANRVHEAFYEPIAIRGLDIPVSLSIGIAECKGDAVTSGTLLRDAHSAVRSAGTMRDGNTRIFDSELFERSRMQLQLEAELRQAADSKALQVYYQPIFDLASSEIIGCEALARWNHPVHGPISPDLFIPLAEDTGLIDTLGTWVLQEACLQTSKWRKELNTDIKVSVNIAPQQFLSGHLTNLVATCLENANLPPNMLKLEITERSIFEERQTGSSSLQGLRDLGVSLVIDDFGTGYSSFEYLIRLEVDELKLDRTFIERLDSDVQLQKVVHAMVTLAHNLGLGVTAEGVENEEQRLLLRGLQCDYAQGFLLSKALPATEFAALMGGRASPPNSENLSTQKAVLTLAKG